MNTIFLALMLSVLAAAGVDGTYSGGWVTSNTKLDGTMTCDLVKASNGYQAHFHGIWKGEAFDYDATFTGSVDNLEGRAIISGSGYACHGKIENGVFEANFNGSNIGKFKLRKLK